MIGKDLLNIFRRKRKPVERLSSKYPSFWYVLAMHIDDATEGGIR